MQAVINLTDMHVSGSMDLVICGVPFLERVILTAIRAGCTNILLIVSPAFRVERIARQLERSTGVQIHTVEVPGCIEIGQAEYWRTIGPHIEDRFVWLPSNFLPHKAALAALISEASTHLDRSVGFASPATPGLGGSFLERPAVLLKSEMLAGIGATVRRLVLPVAPGLPVRVASDVPGAEAELVRHSGKSTDGIYSRFNRALCRPAVRWLSHTDVTPNTVTYGGLAVAVVAALCFAKGTWALDVAGAVLFFISGLFDEIDGMLARLKFKESPFGCWLETMVDYATYLLMFAGMTIGADLRYGPAFLLVGGAVIAGCLLAFVTISIQRRLAAHADRPTEYYQRYLRALERDLANPISRFIRTFQFLLRKGVLVHYVLLFAVLGLLPVVLVLGAIGANIAWIVTIYFNVRLFRRPGQPQVAATDMIGAEVRK